jgi:hypothetical protein
MSSMTLKQTAENPITVTTDETISNFADVRQGFEAGGFFRRNRMTGSLQDGGAQMVAGRPNGDSRATMS